MVEGLKIEKAEALKVTEVKHQGVNEALEELIQAIEAANVRLVQAAQGENQSEPVKGKLWGQWVDPQDEIYAEKANEGKV